MITTARALHQAARLGGRNFVGKLPATTTVAGGTGRMLWTPTTASSRFARTATSANRSAFQKRFATTVAAPEVGSTVATSGGRSSRTNLALGLAGGLVLAGVHSATESQADFFEYRFTTQKSADDLATFYGGEEFMELFSVFPFVSHMMMRNGVFDEEGNVHTTGLPGTLKVSMVFSDEANEETGAVDWFNKRERFRDICLGYTCWDMVINFGFRTLEDGQIEVYHFGEYFHGNLPIVSQLALLVFKTHARWLAWATEHHINHFAFTAKTEKEEEMEEESRKNMPIFLLKHYAWTDLMAMLFGVKESLEEDRSSFLVRRPSYVDDDDTLPIQRAATKIQISEDIASDRMATRGMLARSSTSSDEEVKALLTRSSTLHRNAYSAATEAARLRHLTRRESKIGGDDSTTNGDDDFTALANDLSADNFDDGSPENNAGA